MNNPQKWTLRVLSEQALDTLYRAHIQTDFPSAERPNLSAMRRHIREGLQTAWMMSDGENDDAYAVCAEANGIVLVTLLAVFKDRRGGGRGSALLSLLRDTYRDKRAILLEVEDPNDAEDPDDRLVREKRIAFYERGGYRFLTGIAHQTFGVPLLIMALPLEDTIDNLRASAVADLQTIYHRILPQQLWERVTTVDEAYL